MFKNYFDKTNNIENVLNSSCEEHEKSNIKINNLYNNEDILSFEEK